MKKPEDEKDEKTEQTLKKSHHSTAMLKILQDYKQSKNNPHNDSTWHEYLSGDHEDLMNELLNIR